MNMPLSGWVIDKKINVTEILMLGSFVVGLFVWGSQIDKQVALQQQQIAQYQEAVKSLAADNRDRANTLHGEIRDLARKMDALTDRLLTAPAMLPRQSLLQSGPGTGHNIRA